MQDWNVLKARAKNLAGDDGGGMREITKEEVRRHNSQHDCWSIFRGKVRYPARPPLAASLEASPELDR